MQLIGITSEKREDFKEDKDNAIARSIYLGVSLEWKIYENLEFLACTCTIARGRVQQIVASCVHVHGSNTDIHRGGRNNPRVHCIARIGRSEWRTRRTLPLDLSRIYSTPIGKASVRTTIGRGYFRQTGEKAEMNEAGSIRNGRWEFSYQSSLSIINKINFSLLLSFLSFLFFFIDNFEHVRDLTHCWHWQFCAELSVKVKNEFCNQYNEFIQTLYVFSKFKYHQVFRGTVDQHQRVW